MIQHSIKRQLVSAIVITSSLLTTLVVVLNYYIEYNNDLDGIEIRSRQIEKSILPSLTNSVWNLDISGISTQLKGISALEDVLYVEIKENKNQVFSEGNPSLALSSNTILKTYPLIQQIENEKFNIGHIKIFFSLDNIQEKLIKKLAYFTAFQFLKTLILTILFFIIFQHFLVRHVDKISQYLKNFNIESIAFNPLKLSRNKSSNKKDELDELCLSINTITERLSRNNLYKNQIIKKQENEIVFKNTLEKNELFLKRFSNINVIFDNELRNAFILINKTFDDLEQEVGNNKHIQYLKKECSNIKYIIRSSQLVMQYKNELLSKMSFTQLKSLLKDLNFETSVENEDALNNIVLNLNIKRFTQILELIKEETWSKTAISCIEDKIIFKIHFKRSLLPSDFDISSHNENSHLPIASLIANEEGWKISFINDELTLSI